MPLVNNYLVVINVIHFLNKCMYLFILEYLGLDVCQLGWMSADWTLSLTYQSMSKVSDVNE